MTVTCGFFNSLNGDRKYDTSKVSELFDGLIRDGIFMSIGTAMMVKAGEGMVVNVGEGRAWFNRTWTRNSSIFALEVPASDLIRNRIDAVVLEVNNTVAIRNNEIKIVKGVAASVPVRPTLINDHSVHQYPLCYIAVGAGKTTITQANITNMVGTTSCPFVTGILDTMDIDDLISKWETQWTEWLSDTQSETSLWTNTQRTSFMEWVADQKADFLLWLSDLQGEMVDFKNSNEADFVSWFNNIKDQLSTDAAGNLQNQINELAELNYKQYNGLLTSSTSFGPDENGNIVIVETQADSVETTTIVSTQGTKTIESLLVPSTGTRNYLKTATIEKVGTTTNIEETYQIQYK